jgi:hypothetical protein
LPQSASPAASRRSLRRTEAGVSAGTSDAHVASSDVSANSKRSGVPQTGDCESEVLGGSVRSALDALRMSCLCTGSGRASRAALLVVVHRGPVPGVDAHARFHVRAPAHDAGRRGGRRFRSAIRLAASVRPVGRGGVCRCQPGSPRRLVQMDPENTSTDDACGPQQRAVHHPVHGNDEDDGDQEDRNEKGQRVV